MDFEEFRKARTYFKNYFSRYPCHLVFYGSGNCIWWEDRPVPTTIDLKELRLSAEAYAGRTQQWVRR